jgi:hypothetical protein
MTFWTGIIEQIIVFFYLQAISVMTFFLQIRKISILSWRDIVWSEIP